jgi:hypothetical protein
VMQPSVVYDDDEIQVIWHPAPRDFVLITFGDLGSRANGEKFFADTPVKKTNMACIGVMPKSPNWFPRKSMLAAGPIINSLAANFPSRVLYGGSMGGYGAVKYSKLLRATDVISLCPQFSIASEECDPANNGWQKYYQPALMAGMGINSGDIAGNVNIFYDPYDRIDTYHFDMIKRQNSSVKGRPVPLIGHHVTVAFAGAINLTDLINATMKHDDNELARFVRNRRQYHRWRIERLIRNAFKRRPSAALQLFSKVHGQNPDIMQYVKFSELASLLSGAEEIISEKDIAGYFTSLIRTSSSPRDMLLSALYLENHTSANMAVITDHKTRWYYNPSSDMVVHSANTKGLMPLNFEIQADKVSLSVQSKTISIQLFKNESGTISTKTSEPTDNNRRFKMISNRRGVFNLFDGESYLCAERNGKLTFNRPSAGGWEQFHFLFEEPGSGGPLSAAGVTD